MHLMKFKNTFFPITIGVVLTVISCGSGTKQDTEINANHGIKNHKDQIDKQLSNAELKYDNDNVVKKQSLQTMPIVGANQTDAYLKFLKGKKVGIVANQTSVIFREKNLYTHLVDSLLSLGIDVAKAYAPEHGFRGTADAGELIKDGVDAKTGIRIVSLYGDNKKPKAEQLKNIDIMVFDIQDVGARFYTYISTLHYVMEACAEANIPMLILDRPNPNGNYVDGPILEQDHSSFVGMHPIPIVHGMTIGEYAKMINGEAWLKKGIQSELTVIPVKNYVRETAYHLPIKPSPNLPNDKAINLYPSLCFFEGTNVSVGRGTNKQFQVFGSPYLAKDYGDFLFTPKPNEGAKSPLYQGKVCYGKNLGAAEPLNEINLTWLIEAYQHTADKSTFFNNFFVKLAGTKKLQAQIEQGMSAKAIKASWKEGLTTFMETRDRYLIYK